MRRIISSLSAVLLLMAVVAVAAPQTATSAPADPPPSVAGQLLVAYQRGASAEQRADARSHAGARLVERVVAEASDRTEVELVEVSNGTTRAEAQRRFTSNPTVQFAEPNWIYNHEITSIDPYYTDGYLWGMYGDATIPANQYGSQAGEAWAAAGSEASVGSGNVYVGVIDEGIQFDHPDLNGQVWTNPFDPIDGLDNDGNGYIDDIHGWDFANGDNTIYDGGTSGSVDDHGTHVSGTIGAKSNGSGVVGVNWNVTIISAKFLGANGGTTANAVKAVDYLTGLKTRHGINLVATNNSWGGGGFSQALLDAVNRAGDASILFVAAAGNGGSDGVGDNNDSTATYPSNYQCTKGGTRGYDCVIAVAAITSSGAKSGFSNYGLTTVDLGAPGSGVWSTTAYNTYSSYSGTSMATPHVTGAAALYASSHPGATGQQIKNAILSSAVATDSLAGKTVTGGRLDVSSFLTTTPTTPTVPSAPQNLTATPGDGQITLAWGAPASDGGATITGYNVYRDGSLLVSVVASPQSYTELVANGLSHSYHVSAVNSVGQSGPSNTATATATAVKAPARMVTVTHGAKKKNLTPVTASWTGFTGTSVDISRNGGSVSSILNTGSLTENWRGSGTVTYTVCETSSTTWCATGSTTI